MNNEKINYFDDVSKDTKHYLLNEYLDLNSIISLNETNRCNHEMIEILFSEEEDFKKIDLDKEIEKINEFSSFKKEYFKFLYRIRIFLKKRLLTKITDQDLITFKSVLMKEKNFNINHVYFALIITYSTLNQIIPFDSVMDAIRDTTLHHTSKYERDKCNSINERAKKIFTCSEFNHSRIEILNFIKTTLEDKDWKTIKMMFNSLEKKNASTDIWEFIIKDLGIVWNMSYPFKLESYSQMISDFSEILFMNWIFQKNKNYFETIFTKILRNLEEIHFSLTLENIKTSLDKKLKQDHLLNNNWILKLKDYLIESEKIIFEVDKMSKNIDNFKNSISD